MADTFKVGDRVVRQIAIGVDGSRDVRHGTITDRYPGIATYQGTRVEQWFYAVQWDDTKDRVSRGYLAIGLEHAPIVVTRILGI